MPSAGAQGSPGATAEDASGAANLKFTIRAASTPSDLASYADISVQYYTWLKAYSGLDFTFQKLDEEVAGLPGPFAEPLGVILIAAAAFEDGSTKDVGAVAVRPMTPAAIYDDSIAVIDWSVKTCEPKRLYVLPGWQQYGLGRKLMEAVIFHAEQKGYSRVVLDTLPILKAANGLYGKLGFRQCVSYNGNPLPGVLFWDMLLPRQDQKSSSAAIASAAAV